jgi:hypothetical protein
MSTEPTLPLTLNYRPTLSEQVEAARRYQRTTRKFLLYRGISIAALGAVVWAFLTPGAQLMIPIWLLLAAFTWFDPLPLLLIWLSARPPIGAAPYQATFDEQGIVFDIGGQRVSRAWNRYSKLLETPHLFILVYGGWAYSIIPHHACGDSAAQQQFRTFVMRKIGGR